MSIQDYLIDIGYFINFSILPLLFALAFLFFAVNAVRYFIIGGADSGKREQARQLALYGIAAFVLLVSIWGIVNLLTSAFQIDNDTSFCPDYMGSWCLDSGDNTDSRGWYFEFEV